MPRLPLRKIITTVMHQCEQAEHEDCPAVFLTCASGSVVMCLCHCHKSHNGTDKEKGV